MVANMTPVETRAQDSQFTSQCSLMGLQDRLPLRWPTPSDIPPSPKKSYRSDYTYQEEEDCQNAATWERLSDFDLILRLVDFSGLRPVLAYLLGWTSARGHRPFDPISMFLLHGWQIINGWDRAETLKNLSDPRYADYARRFGFVDGDFPTEGGMRYFLTTLGRNSDADGETVEVQLDDGQRVQIAIQRLNLLIAASVALIREASILSPETWEQALVCPDGMIHDAASQMRCISTQDGCYQPTSPQAPRPCPAKDKGRRGCQCDTTACAQVCRHATPRDPQARYIWYTGSNQHDHSPNQSTDPDKAHKKSGEAHYGYRSLPLQLSDPSRRLSIVLLDDFLPANQREENPAAALLLQLSSFYPDLNLDAVAGDAGLGYYAFLNATYQLGAKRVIDLRADSTDKDKILWPIRGYDDKGRPVCPYGYAFTANGFDASRKRHKWFCGQACLNGATPIVTLEDVNYPPAECPYQAADRPLGQVKNVGKCFGNSSIRLVRDIPVGTPSWKRLYHQARNAVEGRNAAFQRWRLKRMRVYGQPRCQAVIFQADVWLNLTTMARLVREATVAARSP